MKDVAKVMSTWTDQAGYPVVTINTTTGMATQKRFLYNDTAESRFVLKTIYCQSRHDDVVSRDEKTTEQCFSSFNEEKHVCIVKCGVPQGFLLGPPPKVHLNEQ